MKHETGFILLWF